MMRVSAALILLVATVQISPAEMSFDVRQTITGHPALVRKTSERVWRVRISGANIATLDDEFTRVESIDSQQVTLIDHRHKRFASRFKHGSLQKKWASKPVPEALNGVRVEMVDPPGAPASWNGKAVRRDTMRILIPNAPGPGEWRLQVDSAENPPGYQPSLTAIQTAAQRKDLEIDAMVATLTTSSLELLGDVSGVRKRRSPGLPVRSLAQFQLAAASPLIQELGIHLAGYPLMTVETEVENFQEGADPLAFLVPAGYSEVEFETLARERKNR
jgi:hypothetical protein